MSANTAEMDKQLTDEELVERINSGNSEALGILVRAYISKVYNKVQSLVPESDVEDVTQDILLSLVNSIGSFKGRSAFGTWLHRITMNKIADYHRKASRRREKLSSGQTPSIIDPWKETNDELIVKQALMELPEKHRSVLLLKFSEGLSFAEIAETDGYPLIGQKRT